MYSCSRPSATETGTQWFALPTSAPNPCEIPTTRYVCRCDLSYHPSLLPIQQPQAIKICAESQLDGAAEKCAVLNAIEDLVKQKTVVPDVDTLELYEWAAADFIRNEIEYADTLGPLRVRWAKANPKSPLAPQCLQSCLEYWDLVSAQQVCCWACLGSVCANACLLDLHGFGQGVSELGRSPVHVLEHQLDILALSKSFLVAAHGNGLTCVDQPTMQRIEPQGL